ncbi:MAG: flavodoxin domain-containing protein [Thermoplasmatota archaeon]
MAEELGTKAIPANDIKVKELMNYDTIIYGGGIYAERIHGIKFIKKNLKNFQGKRIVVFTNGLSKDEKVPIDKVKQKNFTPDELKEIDFFYMRGGFNMEKLPFKEKMMMTMVKKMMKEGDDLKDDERMLLDALNEPVDHISKENIKGLIEDIK